MTKSNPSDYEAAFAMFRGTLSVLDRAQLLRLLNRLHVEVFGAGVTTAQLVEAAASASARALAG